ncbi:hypothetical protein NIES2119_08605 [[Phormidium ambiguum] IAM M-71]|uniref:Uncharacterized protein n=1 Tax=[Phormidium ambiguum] IAM M-71 TaxID=454136 RepID=A0A1U7IMU2_9CYAN|nr:hypothetical protein [Phormidium ambiguum]OKH38647.1 hypothetical protein NIES2119_08605 [Phormidium ambiguum IAM M-71]
MSLATKPLSNYIAVVFDFDDTLVPDTVDHLLESLSIDHQEFRQQQIQPLVNQGWDNIMARFYALIAEAWSRELGISESQRVVNLAPAEYEEDSELMRSLTLAVESMCKQISLAQLSVGE